MATVTIGKPYSEALLRRTDLHASGHEFDTTPSLSSNVTISKAEHDYLLQAAREYDLLKNALFKGGLTTETLDTLLSGEAKGLTDSPPYSSNSWQEKFVRSVPVTMAAQHSNGQSPDSEDTAVGDGLVQPRPISHSYNRFHSVGQPDSLIETAEKHDEPQSLMMQRLSTHDQRTILISNLSDRTTHKDLIDIIRGGRLLDIFIRNDRCATISFVEGAQDFLAHAKRNDIYLHTKRLEFRWNERQFQIPSHVSNKIAHGATRNIVVRGAVGKLTADQIRDHLDHIHNLVVVDIRLKNGDAYISTNSVHNALFARTCMMSRTTYKGLRIDWYPDECALPLPKPSVRAQTASYIAPTKAVPIANRYMLLDADGLDTESDEDDESYRMNGIRIHNWADTAVA